MTLKQIAQLQRVYSQMYLDGKIDDETYRAVINITALRLNSISEPTLRSLANDTLVLDRLSGNLEKMFQEYENNESGAGDRL